MKELPRVVKRDGRVVAFDKERIIRAVTKACDGVRCEKGDLPERVADQVVASLHSTDTVTINALQELVEECLMEDNRTVARHYIEYRHDRDVSRDSQSRLMREVDGLINRTNDKLLNENANKDSRALPTQRDILAGIISRHYAKNFMLPRSIMLAHDKGELHFHDLDYSPLLPYFNCMLVDLKGMLENGFRMGNAEIETPRSISTACAITAQIVAQVASHTYGGTTLNRLDEVLSPYVTASYQKHHQVAVEWEIKDPTAYAVARTEKETYDAFQALEYEINTLHTANGQTPFVTFGFGLGTTWQARLIQQSILKNRIAGLGRHHKTAVFPKLVFSIKNGINAKPTDKNYDIKQLSLECTSKRIYPDILNYEALVRTTGSFKAPMGCRSFLSRWTDKDGNEVHDGRNNLGVVSLNLPRIGIEAKGSLKRFYEILDTRLDLAHTALRFRIDRLATTKASVAPILYTEGACGVRLNPDDNIAEIFKNGRASISLGYIGIHETVEALIGGGAHPFEDEKKQALGLAIVKYLRDACDRWKEEEGYGYSLYSTPSENLCDRFCRLDKEEFGEIERVTDKGYYTNSFHLDVQFNTDPYNKLFFEKDYPALANGGFICYGEFPNLQHNLKAIEDVWDFTAEHVPYYGTNTPVDECYECGYHGEFACTPKGFECPDCGNHDPKKVSVTRRVCGYLGSPDARPFNEGKQEEVNRRVKHVAGSVTPTEGLDDL